jgi:hypothetical protein
MIRLQAKLDPTRTDADVVKVRGLVYSGGIIRPSGSGPTVIDLTGLELAGDLPLLADHQDDVLHVVGRARPEVVGGAIYIEGELLPGTLVADRLITLLREATPLGLSVGVEVQQSRAIRGDESVSVNGQNLRGPFTLITRGVLREVSIVPVAADREANVRIAATASLEGMHMATTFEDYTRALGMTFNDLPEDQKSWVQAAYERYKDIEARLRLVELRSSRPTPPPPREDRTPVSPPLTAAVLALAGRCDLVAKSYGEQTAEAIDRLRLSGWTGLARHALMQAGHTDQLHLSGIELLKAAFSSSDLPVALTEGLNKLALEAFKETSANWRAVAKTVSVPDFKDGRAIRLSAATKFEPLPPGGELKHGDLAEETFPVKASTFGKIVGLDRQMIVNDDLGLLRELPDILGSEAARLVSDLVFERLATAGAGFFSSAKKNLLTGADSALSLGGLTKAIHLLRTQTDRDGRLIGFEPSVLLVPSSLEFVARQLVNSGYMWRTGADQLPAGNPLPQLQIVVEPRLDASSTTTWYLFARSSDAPMLVAFLNGKESPTVEQVEPPPERLGMVWRAYLDVGAALGEYRAVVKATGA